MSGCVSRASTATLSPCRTLKTPSGSPASFHSSAIQLAAVGILFARLDDHGVAGGDGDREEPHGHHRREVERADDRNRAEGLPDGVDVHLRGGVLGVAALEQVRDAAGELDHFLAAGHLAQGIVQDLAVLGGDDRGELVLAGVQQLAESEEDLGAAGQGRVTPGRESGLRGGNGGVAVLGAGQGHLGGDFSGGGVGDGRGALADRDVAAVDPVLDDVQGISSGVGAFGRLMRCVQSVAGAGRHKGRCVKENVTAVTLCKCCQPFALSWASPCFALPRRRFSAASEVSRLRAAAPDAAPPA